jgi:predicted lactoylglutathione lyase
MRTKILVNLPVKDLNKSRLYQISRDSFCI